MLRVLLYVSICLRFGDGFLLETNTQKATNLTGADKQYVTLNEFYEAKKEQQYDLNVLSHKMERMKADSEKTLTLLTSQIQQKLLSMETSFKVNGQKNETDELQQLHQINTDLENRFTKLQQNFDNLQTKYKVIEIELLQSRNTTSKLSAEFQTLQQLKTVQQLQDVNGLKLEVQSISTQTHSLAVNQQARNQDFLALYNQTIINQNQQDVFKNQTLASFQNIKRNQNISTSDLNGKIDQIVRTIKRTNARVDNANETIKRTNARVDNAYETIKRTNARVDNAYERVALTSCVVSDQTVSAGEAIVFNGVKTKVGIDNLSTFTSTGKFTCTKPGLYLVSIWVLTKGQNNPGTVFIYRNDKYLTKTYISTTTHYDTGTATAAVELQLNDKVWVRYDNGRVDSYGTCMTIVKLM